MLFIVFLMFSAFVSKYIKSKETHSCEISLQVDGRNPASDSAKLISFSDSETIIWGFKFRYLASLNCKNDLLEES